MVGGGLAGSFTVYLGREGEKGRERERDDIKRCDTALVTKGVTTPGLVR